jgi:ABC-type amino acid transport substrate-binding protein
MRRTTRRVAAVAVLVGLVGGLTTAGAQQTTWQRVQAEKKLQIVMASGYPPFSFIGENGKQTGFDTDLAEEFARRSGLELVVKLVAFEGVVPALIGRQTDMVVSIYATDARRKVVDFTDSYWKAGLSFVTLKGKPPIESLEDAAGKTIGVLQGGFSQRFLSQNAPKAVLKAYKGGPVEVLSDLAIGRIDASFDDRDVASYYLRTQPGKYQFGSRLFGEGEYAWAIRKEDRDLLEAANRFLAEAKRDGTIDRLAKKWSIGPNAQQ